ncbi:pectate lyase E [Corynespora cassiicola Philippines]|uniref:Pectate lyase n=1 Tax=Corynespora cassiicola Philippines TaxID=1448308 RepID=A0A2T2N5A1_CORCC|nr:pectate lyase E [Corynespora cassiicola Philippines]
MQYSAILAILAATAAAGPSAKAPRNFFSLTKRASLSVPASQGTVTFDAPEEVSGEFDGGMKTYGRGVSCTGQAEGGDSDAVFNLADGATLKNAIIGEDQIEGVHCQGSCTIENVWWIAVCEDALSLKGDGDATVTGGGAQGAEDKVIQHNGVGTVTINGFEAVDVGKVYRSCGNCKNNPAERHVKMTDIKVTGAKMIAGINSNFGDTAEISGCATDAKEICTEFEGVGKGSEPEEVSSGPSAACVFTDLPAC